MERTLTNQAIRKYPFLATATDDVRQEARVAVWLADGDRKKAWRILVRRIEALARDLGWRRVQIRGVRRWRHERDLVRD